MPGSHHRRSEARQPTNSPGRYPLRTWRSPKWGIEGYVEALAQEIEPFGIKTMLVEPGMVRTTFYDAAESVALSQPYQGGPADRPRIPIEEMVGSQSGVAHAIIEAALSGDPPLRLLLNSDAYALVTAALRGRLTAFEAQGDTAALADDDYPVVSRESA